MIYIDYHDYKNKQLEAQHKYDSILAEKERLFTKTQPASAKYDDEKVSNSNIKNKFDEYLIVKEKYKIDDRLKEIKSILDDRTHILKLKEEELRKSKDWYDKIYVYYYLDRLPVRKIQYMIPYSRTRIFDILSIINTNCSIKKYPKSNKKSGQNRTNYIIK